ncbi:MAG: hypothetical protein J6T00_01520 [Bacteroidaceae bacterium]|nr:hypothetical protein [Bacteroidaceae bacterium]
MALIKCKECGHMISEKALACPKCGCSVGKGNNLLEEKGNTNKNYSTPSKSVGKKWSTSNILWIVIPLFPFVLLFLFAVYVAVSEGFFSSDSDSSTTEASYGPGTYEFVDEAGQQWQLIIEIERTGSEEDYSLKEDKVCKFKNLSNGEEYKARWYDEVALYYAKGVNSRHYGKCFRIFLSGAVDCPIVFQKIPNGEDTEFFLEDGYIYICSTWWEDVNGNDFGFEKAFINRDSRIRLPVKKIK